jgi:probable F420-dependent oxidoreductase
MQPRRPSIGLFSVNHGATADPGGAKRIAELAERLGYDSLWAGEHVVVPSPRVEPSPMDADEPILDPLLSLTYAAAVTGRIRLGTGLIVLPQRNPLVLAKQVVSLDVLSGGRLSLGVGAGYLEPELRAIGVPMAERGARTDEYLCAMRSLWQDDRPEFHGRFVDFAGVDAYPRPVQRPLPIVVGGHSPAAHRRAVRYGDGWFGFMLGLRAAAEQCAAVRQAAVRHAAAERDRPLHISVAPARRLDAEVVGAYADLGVDRLIVVPPPMLPLDQLVSFVEDNAPNRIGGEPLPAAQID